MPVKQQQRTLTADEQEHINHLPEVRGVRQILSDIAVIDGGWNQNAARSAIKNKQDKNGAWLITYSFDSPPPTNREDVTLPYLTYEKSDRITMRKALDQIEAVANIKFQEADTAKATEANIRYYKVDITDDTIAGFEDGNHRVFMEPAYSTNLHTALHETMHALGLIHPGELGMSHTEGGYNRWFNQDMTTMSYNRGDISTAGLGSIDVEALQHIYGPAKNKTHATTITTDELLNKRFLYSENIPTVRLKEGYKGVLVFDEHEITGYLEAADNAYENQVRIKMVGKTAFSSVIAHHNLEAELNLTGNDRPNWLMSGKGDDSITPRGGDDILAGRGGNNGYFINGESGHGNVILDFDPKKDTLILQKPIVGTTLVYESITFVDDEGAKGTQVTCMDQTGQKVASVFCIGVTPEQLKERMLNTAQDSVASTPEQNSTHPSGLPDIVRKYPNDGKVR